MHRIAGLELGHVGSSIFLEQGMPWVPRIGLCRKTENGRDAGNVFVATVVTPLEAFEFRQLRARGPAGEISLPGRIVGGRSWSTLNGRRYSRDLEVPLSDADVEWLVAAGDALELRMETEDQWIMVPPGAALAQALRDYRDRH
jgi:hypothetical protein